MSGIQCQWGKYFIHFWWVNKRSWTERYDCVAMTMYKLTACSNNFRGNAGIIALTRGQGLTGV